MELSCWRKYARIPTIAPASKTARIIRRMITIRLAASGDKEETKLLPPTLHA